MQQHLCFVEGENKVTKQQTQQLRTSTVLMQNQELKNPYFSIKSSVYVFSRR